MESTHIDAIETKVGVVKNIIDEADKKWSPFLRQVSSTINSDKHSKYDENVNSTLSSLWAAAHHFSL